MNTHPFPIKGGAMIHNGTLEGTGSKFGEGKSDTCLFAERFFADLDHATLLAHKKDFEDAIGWNRMAFLYDDAKFVILNEKSGEWDNDVWFSNTTYKRNFVNRNQGVTT